MPSARNASGPETPKSGSLAVWERLAPSRRRFRRPMTWCGKPTRPFTAPSARDGTVWKRRPGVKGRDCAHSWGRTPVLRPTSTWACWSGAWRARADLEVRPTKYTCIALQLGYNRPCPPQVQVHMLTLAPDIAADPQSEERRVGQE